MEQLENIILESLCILYYFFKIVYVCVRVKNWIPQIKVKNYIDQGIVPRDFVVSVYEKLKLRPFLHFHGSGITIEGFVVLESIFYSPGWSREISREFHFCCFLLRTAGQGWFFPIQGYEVFASQCETFVESFAIKIGYSDLRFLVKLGEHSKKLYLVLNH